MAYTPPAGDSRFWAWLKAASPYSKTLAWCHTTDAFRFRSILETASFTPCHCNVFDEPLAYLFYGRPAYRRTDEAAYGSSARAPVVIIFRPEIAAHGRRLFPFDSGAFADKRYAKWMHHGMQLSDFELACKSDAPQRHVTSYFGSNDGYLRLQAKAPAGGLSGEYEAEAIYLLLTDLSTESADDRRIAVELQLDDTVTFDAANVLAIVVPEELQSVSYFKTFLSGPGAGVDVLTYQQSNFKLAREYQGLLEERAIDFQKVRGLV